jgi:4a-hydroxytetrahydrobiopterin dehydratase
MGRMTDEELRAAVAGSLPGWTIQGDAIHREFTFPGFTAAVAFIDRMVQPANAARHHPDLEVHFNRVIVSLSTHDEGGVTDKDIELARSIDQLADG